MTRKSKLSPEEVRLLCAQQWCISCAEAGAPVKNEGDEKMLYGGTSSREFVHRLGGGKVVDCSAAKIWALEI